jgi:hypothetical protein
LIEGITKTINSKPDEPWLVIHHINVGRDIPAEVRALLRKPDNVSFLNWGRHNATNEFKHIRNVILAGTPFLPKSHLEALARLAAQRPTTDGRITEADLHSIEQGEHRHAILQAVARSAVRQCEGERCPMTSAYIIAHPRSGIGPKMLDSIFPGCRVVRWQPHTTALRGKAGKAQSYILEAFAKGDDAVTFSTVKQHVGVSNAGNFANTIRKKIADALAAQGIIEWPQRRPTGWRRAATAFFGNETDDGST